MKAITAELIARAVGCGRGTSETIPAPMREAVAAHEVDESSCCLGCFLAQVGHESLDFSRLYESLSYRPERLQQVCSDAKPGTRWPSLLPRVAKLANNPQGLGKKKRGQVFISTGSLGSASQDFARQATEQPEPGLDGHTVQCLP